MTEGNENGARLLLDEIAEIQKAKKMSHHDRLLWRVHEYQLRETISVRDRLHKIENSNALWVDRHPKAARAWGIFLLMFLNSDVRQPVMAWLGSELANILKLLG